MKHIVIYYIKKRLDNKRGEITPSNVKIWTRGKSYFRNLIVYKAAIKQRVTPYPVRNKFYLTLHTKY